MAMIARVVVLVSVGVLATGCGSGTSSTPSGEGSASVGGGSTAKISDVCALVSAADLSAAVGATVTTKTGPGGDCEFSQQDARALSGSVGTVAEVNDNGGYAGYASGLGASLTNPQHHDVAGVGDRAVVYLGTAGGGTNLMAAGAAEHGGRVLTVTMSQATHMSADALSAIAEKLLKVLVAKVN